MMKYMKYQPPIDCGPEKDWVEVNGSIARITDEAKEKHGDILCLFTGKHAIDFILNLCLLNLLIGL